jgi:hypothetical protein
MFKQPTKGIDTMNQLKLKPVASNMNLLETPAHIVLFSYATPVASFDKGTYSFNRTSKKWSMTTSRHINKWLDGAKAIEQPQTYFDDLLGGV